uniref:Family with sequence similarity 86 member B2 n=1 Tax=Homo sapiens TaxID=9606 RepID=A0AAG2UXA4_HUMAN
QSLEAKLRDSSYSELLRDILQKTVRHPVCVKHPPSVKYAWFFLSELIKKRQDLCCPGCPRTPGLKQSSHVSL